MEKLSVISSDLEQVKSEFQLWRSRQVGRRIIPQYLWNKAFSLLENHSLSVIVRQLGLSRDRLLARLHQSQEIAPSSTSVSTQTSLFSTILVKKSLAVFPY